MILAALAADAAPGKNFSGVKKLDSDENVEAILLRGIDAQRFVFKMASSPAGQTQIATERSVAKALSKISESLPFEISREIGATRDAEGEVGILFSYVEGEEPDLVKLPPGAFSKTLADALAAIHSLNLGIVKEAGLPEYDASHVLHQRVSELDRIAATGRVPAELLSRWEAALEDVGLFRFHPTVVHGSISKDSLKLAGQRVVGVTGFENLKISDPAEDLSWIIGAGLSSTVEDTLLHYRAARPSADENLLQRATLYSELELGSWLVHCIEQGDEESATQAEEMVTELRDQLEAGSLPSLRAASFAGLVAGSALLPEVTSAIPLISESSAPAEESEIENEQVTESLEISDLFEPEPEQKPNPDELF